ncbi:MAG: hypothetical protein ABIT96_01580 [Ferruginibacter sp.]
MKKILLSCAVLLCVFTIQAQTKKSKKSSKNVSYATKEKRANAAFQKKQAEKQAGWEEARIERLQADSQRVEDERLSDSTFQVSRVEWKEARLHEIDSVNQEKWKSHAMSQEESLQFDRERTEIIKEAKLDNNIGRQVKYINATYSGKAAEVRNNMELTEQQKHDQLVSLNNERRSKIEIVTGKSKFRKYEKARKDYLKKNPSAMNELSWTDTL